MVKPKHIQKIHLRKTSITQDMRFRLSLLNYVKNMESLRILPSTRPTSSISTVGNGALTVLLSPSRSAPGYRFIIPTGIPVRNSS